MHSRLILCAVLALTPVAMGQNLLVNPSFDLPTPTTPCPQHVKDTQAITGWFSPGNFFVRNHNFPAAECISAAYASISGQQFSAPGFYYAQTVTVNNAAGPYTFSGQWGYGIVSGGTNVTVSAEIRSGNTTDGALLGEESITAPYPTFADTWRGFAASADKPAGVTQLTVVLRLIAPNGFGVYLIADECSLVQTVCPNLPTVTSMNPNFGARGNAALNATINGSNFLAGQTTVRMRKVGQVDINGTSVNVGGGGNSLTAAFNLTNAAPGHWDVAVTVGTCPERTLAGGFLVALPALSNGSFELPTASQNCGPPPTVIPGVPTDWQAQVELARDHNVWAPTCPNPTDGGHYGSMTTGVGASPRAWQTLVVSPGSRYQFSGQFAGGGDDTIAIGLLDGDENGTEIAATPIKSGGSNLDWTVFSVEGTATSGLMTAVWQMTNTVGACAAHADGLTFVSTVQCNTPFADADDDGDVDQDDFAIWQLCTTGAEGGPVPSSPTGCSCFNRDADTDVDQADFVKFQDCASGPDVPWTPSINCP